MVEYSKIIVPLLPTIEAERNLDAYLSLINSTEASGLDILVFPESTLNSRSTAEFIPEVEDNITPCDDNKENSPIIAAISCAARDTDKYIVINLSEKSICPDRQQIAYNDTRPCPADKINIYNTNVVFDNRGALVSKYRKYNLYGEAGVVQPLYPISVPFTTRFGVKFAQMICFDLLFERPAMDLVSEGVTDFIISKMWFSKAPFLTATQVQQAWAFGNNVNLLAAGSSRPEVGSSGSGIYHGRMGALTAVMTGKAMSKIYRAIVPKMRPNRPAPVYGVIDRAAPEDMTNLFLKRDNFTPFSSVEVPPVNGHVVTYVCNGEICCDFDLDVKYDLPSSDSVAYRYRLVAYSGLRTFFSDVPKREAVQLCAILACKTDDVDSCSDRFEKDKKLNGGFTFIKAKIETELRSDQNILAMPTSADLSIMPYRIDDFSFQENTGLETRQIVMELIDEKRDIFSFGIWARNFDNDA